MSLHGPLHHATRFQLLQDREVFMQSLTSSMETQNEVLVNVVSYRVASSVLLVKDTLSPQDDAILVRDKKAVTELTASLTEEENTRNRHKVKEIKEVRGFCAKRKGCG